MKRICLIEGCANQHLARGWCAKHYQRWQKYGATDKTTRIVPGTTRNFLQEILANCKPQDGCITWPFCKTKKGYGRLTVNHHTHNAHRVILKMAAGLPQSEELHAAHKCGNPSCVNPHHLYWATGVENAADQLIHDTHIRGERNGQSKLTVSQIYEIRRDPRTHKKIASCYKVARQTISRIKNKTRWGWMEEQNCDSPTLIKRS